MKSERISSTIICVIFLFSISACEFDPEGEYFIEIENKKPSNIFINLNEANDTIPLVVDTDFFYSVETGNRHIIQLEIRLDDQLVHSSRTTSDNFILRPQNYSSGFHELQIAFIANSGTGSLADALGSEVLTAERKWIIQVDHNPLIPISIVEVKPEQGQLLVSWEKFEGINFRQYVVYKNGRSTYFPLISDRDQNYIYDDQYVGGKVTYRVDVLGYSQKAEGKTFTYYDSVPQIYEIENDKISTVTFAWNKAKYYSNFGSYNLYILNGDRRILLSQHTEINDTSTTISDVPFGNEATYELITVPEGSTYNNERSRVNITTGQDFFPFSQLRYHPENQSYYLQTHQEVHRFSENELSIPAASISMNQEIDFASSNFSISENGQQAYVNTKDAILLLDPMTLGTQQKINTTSFIKNGASPGSLSVSNQHQLLFTSLLPTRGGVKTDSVYYVDLNTSPPNVIVLGNYKAQGRLSNSGKYVSRIYNYLFKITPSGYDTLSSLPHFVDAEFVGDQREELLLIATERSLSQTILTWKSVPDFQTTRNLTLNTILENLSIDFENNHIGGKSRNSSYHIYDLGTGLLLDSVKITYNPASFYLQNKILFSNRGKYMTLDL